VIRILVAFDTKYGNTHRVAEIIAKELRGADGIEVTPTNMKEFNFGEVDDFDVILMGSPNHIGGPTRTFKKFVDKLQKTNLKGKSAAVFDTYIGEDFEKASKKMEKRIREKLPDLKLIVPGLSVKVEGTKGPIVESELPKCKELGQRIALQLGI
jgi:flavodoxin